MLSKSINNKDNKSQVMIVEDGGLPITRGLKVGDPGKKQMNCVFGDNDCIVSPNHKCDQNVVVYKIQCKSCNSVTYENNNLTSRKADMKKPSYIGLTRTALHDRMNSHLRSRRYKNASSPMWRHDREAHQGIS